MNSNRTRQLLHSQVSIFDLVREKKNPSFSTEPFKCDSITVCSFRNCAVIVNGRLLFYLEVSNLPKNCNNKKRSKAVTPLLFLHSCNDMKVAVILLVLWFRLKLQLNIPSPDTCYLRVVRRKFCKLINTGSIGSILPDQLQWLMQRWWLTGWLPSVKGFSLQLIKVVSVFVFFHAL